ncbi:hypothetical protein PsorP6_003791 [Peronosclerospora sorghi]|uniref:Uncharacterized protein n=1 Tax=Peronosclerospora sorghi TaxID=230839 RepID=A0ACC0VK53_9STRA|nr:hypothetical protein PsorP6_003791 [Peronosclerospora sorghi]
MSALDIDWMRPVAPDGTNPLEILIDWFTHNGVVYHASTHQREVLVPLCRELNARGLPCEVDQILDYISYLQEVVHGAAALHKDLPVSLKPYVDRLQKLLFKDGCADALISQQKARFRSPNRLSWLEPSAYCGLSGMEMLVDWLKNNYSAYARAVRKGEKGKMLEDLVKEMKGAGIQDCAVNTIRAKIDVLHREVRGEKSRSAAWEQFGSVLEEIFTMGDAGQERDDRKSVDKCSNIQKIENFDSRATEEDKIKVFKHPSGANDVTRKNIFGNQNSLVAKTFMKHTRSSPTSRLSWMKPAAPGFPCAMELLVEWMERHYAEYTQSTKKGEKGKMLAKLLHKIEDVGHQGCTIHAIRVKIDSLQRQAGGRARPSLAFDQFGDSLRKVFAERDGIDTMEARVLSPVEHQSSESHISGDDDIAGDEMAEEIALAEDKTRSNYQNLLVETISTEHTGTHAIENHDTESTHVADNTILGAVNNSEHAPDSSGSETEEDKNQSSKKQSLDSNARHRPSSPTQSPSTSEIVRIATLLRERHDLHQRGVPQEQIDKFLPLPKV